MDYKEDEVEITPQDSHDEQLINLVMREWAKGSQHYDKMNDLYDDLYSMLRGERPQKNYDWQSNIVINKVFQVIWTAIPYLTQKIFGATPIVGIKSYDKEGAWQREEILEFWHNMNSPVDKKHTPFYVICVLWTLRGLLNGVGIIKKSWHQKLKKQSQVVPVNIPVDTDENGELITEFQEQRVTKTVPIEDWPHNEVINNKDLVFDWLLKPGQSIRDGRFIIHKEIQDLDYLYSKKYMNLDQLVPSSEKPEDHDEALSKDGLESPPDSDFYSEVEVYERVGVLPIYKKKRDGSWKVCFDRKHSDDVEFVEMIVTIAKSEDKKTLIRLDKNPYGLKNYIDIPIYLDPERWQAMGMIEPIKDTQTAINDNINAMFDEIWQNLMPPVVVNKYALWDWDSMQYAPQQKWLVGGDPSTSIMFKEPSYITRDAWTKHSLLDNELQLTSAITPPMQGMGKEKAATTNVLNAQMSAGRLDYIIKIIEQMGLIPSAQMDVLFAKKFAHPMTFQKILGKPFQYSEDEEFYKYIPGASSVKLEHQREVETTQDIQLIQILSSIQNPKMPALVNKFLQNILRNRNNPEAAAMLDEGFYEPKSDAGNLQVMQQMLGRTPSNQAGLDMSNEEKSTRRLTYQPRGV